MTISSPRPGLTLATMGFAVVAVLALVLLLDRPTPAAASSLDESISISIEGSESSVPLGGDLELGIMLTNHGTEASPPLIVHLDITEPASTSSVDPEDWTSTLSKQVGVIDAGGVVVVDWSLQPIASGDFVIYAVVISPGVDALASSNLTPVTVVSQRSLNPGGILPVAIGAPSFVALLLVVQMRYARRTTYRTSQRAVGAAI